MNCACNTGILGFNPNTEWVKVAEYRAYDSNGECRRVEWDHVLYCTECKIALKRRYGYE